MPTFSNIGIDEPGTIDKRAASVSLDRGGVVEEREIVVLGDPDSTNAIAAVLNTTPGSTAWALAVREVAQTTTVQVSSVGGAVTVRSSAADAFVTVSPNSTAAPASNDTGVVVRQVGYVAPSTTQQVSSVAGRVEVGEYSSAAPAATSTGLVVRQVGYSTTINVSSLAGLVAVSSIAGRTLVDQNSTVWPVQVSSVAGRILADQNSTVWFTQAVMRDGSGTALVASTSPASSGSQGLHVRQILPGLQSTAFSTIGNNSTSSTIVSSVAGVRHCVYAYSITSTVQAVNTLTFASSLANLIWTVQLQSISSGISGANLAVSPPGWLFATDVANPLVFKVTGTTGTYHLSFSYFTRA